jgi:hypothetical protein
MFYMNIRHNVKKDSSSKNTFHYLTRTAHFAEQKADEELEFVRSGNMPAWAVDAPASFGIVRIVMRLLEVEPVQR